jgi:hypothetical protein
MLVARWILAGSIGRIESWELMSRPDRSSHLNPRICNVALGRDGAAPGARSGPLKFYSGPGVGLRFASNLSFRFKFGVRQPAKTQ